MVCCAYISERCSYARADFCTNDCCARVVRVGHVAQGIGHRRGRTLARAACVCVSYRFPSLAVWAPIAQGPFGKKKMRRSGASEVGGHTDRHISIFRHREPQ